MLRSLNIKPDMKPIIRLAVIANNIQWDSLNQKLQDVKAFYAPICDLRITVEHTSLRPIFKSYPEIAPIFEVDFDWYDQNISKPRELTADIVMFVIAGPDHAACATPMGIMTQNNLGPWETTIFAEGENDGVYIEGRSLGNSFTHYAIHELSHVFYYMLGIRDRTHEHFPVGQTPYNDYPANVLSDLWSLQDGKFQLSFWGQQLQRALVALGLITKQRMQTVADPEIPHQIPAIPPQTASGLAWDTPEHSRHSVRVLADEMGLNLAQKEILCACIMRESQFNNAAVGRNPSSTDWGICQINDHYQVGPGRPFSSVRDIVDNPEKAVRFMISMYKAGKLSLWVSYSSGAYKQFLPK